MPDEVDRPAVTADALDRAKPEDLIDQLFAYRLAFGCEPESYRHYVYGMRHLARVEARMTRRTAAALKAGQSTEDGFKDWMRNTEKFA